MTDFTEKFKSHVKDNNEFTQRVRDRRAKEKIEELEKQIEKFQAESEEEEDQPLELTCTEFCTGIGINGGSIGSGLIGLGIGLIADGALGLENTVDRILDTFGKAVARTMPSSSKTKK